MKKKMKKLSNTNNAHNPNNIKALISKISFMFLAYAVLAGGYVTQLLPCSTQYLLDNNIIIKHLTGFLLIFCFIMMEGGWDFDEKENAKAPVDWSSGNTLHTMGWATLIYSLFLLTSKMKVAMNLLLYAILFVIYIINTYSVYLDNRKRISDEQKQTIQSTIKVLIVTSIIIFLVGIVDYYNYEKDSYGKDFSLMTFLAGTNKCTSMK